MLHRVNARVLCLLVVGAVLYAACGPAQPTEEAAPEAAASEQVPAGEEEIPASADNPVTLRVGVDMTAPELETFMPLLDQVDQAHPEWILVVEQTPQSSAQERLTAAVAAGTLPDVQMMRGLGFNHFMRSGAFLPLDNLIETYSYPMDDYFPYILDEWTFQDQVWGIPNTAAPDILSYNTDMFDAAGLAYPDDSWTWDDLREAAITLTLDSEGRNPRDPNFDPEHIVQWGYNFNPGALGIWANSSVVPWGGDLCADEACTTVSMTDPEDLEALNWWYNLVVVDHAAVADPFNGANTGVPGDAFVNGFAAMGGAGYYVIGQIRAVGGFQFGVAQLPEGPAGRATNLSTTGWGIAENSQYPDEAFKLIQELTSTEFLRDMWALPGHSVPARRSAAQSVLTLQGPPDDLAPVLAVMEYARGFRPNGPAAFEAYFASYAICSRVFNGEITVEDGYAQAQEEANALLTAALEEAGGQ